MSNWQQQAANAFNLDAPEFVPKFGSSQGGNPNQQMPHQQQMRFPPGMNQQQPHMYGPPGAYQHPQYQNQMHYPNQHLPPQQQQPFHQMPPGNNNYRPPYQYQGQHPQQPFQQPGFVQQPNHQQTSPQTHKQPQSPPVQQQQAPRNGAPAATDSDVSQLAGNVAKLTTESKPAAAAAAAAAAPVQPAPVAAAPAPAQPKPEVVKKVEPVAEKKEEPQPSVEKEKSAAPSVAAIKEDASEEWCDDEEAVEEDEVEGEAAVEGAKPSKKQLVIREYKPKKEPVNVIFCGHVDAGKSTIGGQIMFLTGMVDKRTLEKYEREAKEKNRETWYLSWALDTNIEEREKGKTVEVGRAFFETEKRHFIILDAPGHRGFVPNMIGGASQADVAVLVISARRGEFETGFERGGQTREHAMLVKTAGVKFLIVLVNKMDDPTVMWDQARYDDIKDKLTPYLKKCGFQPGKDTFFMPCSGYTGAFIKEPAEESLVPWYRGPCFIDTLDNLPPLNRTVNGPVRMPIIDKYKDMGTVVMGKIESGMVRLNDKLIVMPNKVKVEVVNIYCEEDETDSAICGENVKLKLKGIEEEEISSGFVLCDVKDVCHVAKVFDAQVVILEYPSIICPGFNSIMHLHASTVEVQLKGIIGMVDKKTGEKDLKNRPRFIKQDQIAICRFEVLGGNIVCVESFKSFPQLGRFTLRYENKTVSIGKVLKIIE